MPPNTCNFSRKLSAYLDGELAASEWEAVKAHLAACEDCSEELLRLSSMDSALRTIPAIEPPSFFAAKVTAAAKAMNEYHGPFRNFLRVPVPAMALMVSFIIFNLFTFAFNINALENGPRREIARKVAAQLTKPASLINPVAVARLSGECSKYMCLCMHEAGRKNQCPCKDCEMGKMDKRSGTGAVENMEEHHVN
jgi:anti-sigma factor RsiW